MNRYFQAVSIFLLVVFIYSCTNELGVESFDFERSVVVDALFTDEEKVHEIRLSYSSPVEQDTLFPLTLAQVWIEDDNQTVLNFDEASAGYYRSESVFKGVTGRSYKLVFITESGQRYESDPELLIKSPEIEQIRHELISRPIDRSAEFEQGLQFFIDSKDESGDAQFFRYEWNSAKKTTVPYPEQYKVRIIPDQNPLHTPRYILTPHPQDRIPETCFELINSSRIILSNTLGLTESSALDVPAGFFSVNYLNFMERFTLEISQYAISQEAFNYYRLLKDFNETNGSLFDKQQGAFGGNMRSISDPDEVVLGYFEVGGLSRKRVFYNFDDFGDALTKFSDVCETNTLNVHVTEVQSDGVIEFVSQEFFDRFGSGDFRIYDVANFEMKEWRPGSLSLFGDLLLASNFCVNCRNYGDLILPPDYWID